MLYTYSKTQLLFTKVSNFKIVKLTTIALTFIVLASMLAISNSSEECFEDSLQTLTYEKKVIIINDIENESFTKEEFIKEIKRLNIRFPHIVMAQAMIESGHFQSNIFRSNHNLFGMKQARQRVTTARGTNLGHAYYDNWKESVMDYAVFQSAYLRDLKTEAAYLEYLDKNYAMAPNYDIAVLNMVKNENLRELFK